MVGSTQGVNTRKTWVGGNQGVNVGSTQGVINTRKTWVGGNVGKSTQVVE